MAFIDVFGNSIVQTAESTYTPVTLSTAVTQLTWPALGQNSEFVLSRQMDVTSEDAAYILKMPDASVAPPGESLFIKNVSTFDFVLQDYDGNEIIAAITPGLSFLIYLTDNSTSAGTWGNIQNGAGTSSADASILSGLGLTPLLGKLNINYPTEEITTFHDGVAADRGKFFIYTGGTSIFTLPITDIPNGFKLSINNQSIIGGQLNMTVEGGGTVDNITNFALSPQESVSFVKYGTDYKTLGLGKETVFTVQVNDKEVSPGGTFDMLDSEAERLIQKYSGALTSDVIIDMPDNANTWQVFNGTTGSYTLTVKTPSSAGIEIEQNVWKLVTYDGTDTIEVPTLIDTSAIHLADGTISNPSLNYENETDFGWYRSSSSRQELVKNGVSYVELGINGIGSTDGTAAEPSIFFMNATDVGLSIKDNRDLVVSTGGVETFKVGAYHANVTGGLELNEGATQAPILYVEGIPYTSILKLFSSAL